MIIFRLNDKYYVTDPIDLTHIIAFPAFNNFSVDAGKTETPVVKNL